MERGSSQHSCILAVNKPYGLSSHDVVNIVRKKFQEKRVGHLGTLDPNATGVLLVCVGPATRLNKYFVEHDKEYEFDITFGTSTDTDDTEGSVIATCAIPAQCDNFDYASKICNSFIGQQEQIPPAYSAIKVHGKKAYESARRGQPLELTARNVSIYSIKLVSIHNVDGAIVWTCIARVSKGTYIRALGRDIAKKAGCVGHVSRLNRLCVGPVGLDFCGSIEAGSFEACYVNPQDLLDMPVVDADEFSASIANGKPIPELNDIEDSTFIALLVGGRLKAIYKKVDKTYIPDCVFAIGVGQNDL